MLKRKAERAGLGGGCYGGADQGSLLTPPPFPPLPPQVDPRTPPAPMGGGAATTRSEARGGT